MINKLKCEGKRGTNILEISDGFLVDRWFKGDQSREKKIPLRDLSPDFTYVSGRPENFKFRVIAGIICFSLGVVCFYSTIQDKLPLLSFFFALNAIWLIFLAIRSSEVLKWTIVNGKDGEKFAWFVHNDCDDSQRKDFEKALEVAIDSTRKRDNQQDSPSPTGAD